MIGFIDDITGSPCYFCGEPIDGAWALHELDRDVEWVVICIDCHLVTEVGDGK